MNIVSIHFKIKNMAANIYLGASTGVPGNGTPATGTGSSPTGFYVGADSVSEIYLGSKRIK